jgi:hypothetical protein
MTASAKPKAAVVPVRCVIAFEKASNVSPIEVAGLRLPVPAS